MEQDLWPKKKKKILVIIKNNKKKYVCCGWCGAVTARASNFLIFSCRFLLLFHPFLLKENMQVANYRACVLVHSFDQIYVSFFLCTPRKVCSALCNNCVATTLVSKKRKK